MDIKNVNYNEMLKENMDILSKGAFLTTKVGDKVNSMTIAWGSIGFMWNKPIFMAMVRPQRYTYDLIESSSEFTVTIPYENVKEAVAFLGTKSGRDMNKLSHLGIDTIKGQKIDTPVLNMKGMHFECKIVYKTKMTNENLDSDIDKTKYPAKDYHTLYFGEIVSSYTVI